MRVETTDIRKDITSSDNLDMLHLRRRQPHCSPWRTYTAGCELTSASPRGCFPWCMSTSLCNRSSDKPVAREDNVVQIAYRFKRFAGSVIIPFAEQHLKTHWSSISPALILCGYLMAEWSSVYHSSVTGNIYFTCPDYRKAISLSVIDRDAKRGSSRIDRPEWIPVHHCYFCHWVNAASCLLLMSTDTSSLCRPAVVYGVKIRNVKGVYIIVLSQALELK